MKYFLVLPLLIAASVVDWLFPFEGQEYRHYEGLGEYYPNYKSWDEMTRDEKEDSVVRMFK